MKRPIMLLCFLAMAFSVPAIDVRDEFTRRMDEGIAAYESGDYETALEAFTDARVLRPESGEARMNIGLAQARLGEYEEALEAFEAVAEQTGGKPERRANALYNRGRTLFDIVREEAQSEQPDRDSLVQRGLESLRTFEQALELQPGHEEAEFNRAQVQNFLEQLALQVVPPPQSGQGEQEEDDQEEQDQQNQQQEQQSRSDQQDQNESPQERQQSGDQSQEDESGDQSGENQSEDQQQPTGQKDQGKQQQDQQQGDRSEERQEQEEESGEQDAEQQQQQNQHEQQGEQGDEGQRGSAAAEQREEREGRMSEKQARALLNLLGNENVLKLIMPTGKGQTEPPEKEW